jgi:NADH-quinone oxidoreductase subunit H
MLFYSVLIFLKVLLAIIPLLIAVAYFTLAERKILGSMARRLGPNTVGIFGLTQALADGLKLFLKETILPSNSNIFLFLLAPILSFLLGLIGWAVIPLGIGMVIADVNLGILFLFAVSSLAVYGIILGGWASNSKYAFLGALRSTAQMVSYEVSIGFIIICVVLAVGSTNITDIVIAQKRVWFFLPLFPMFVLFFISAIAETNRHPFDMPEAEAELVAGYNVEYSAMGFALFFLGEYANMLLMSAMSVLLFLGGWLPPLESSFFYFIPGCVWFALKSIIFVSLFVWARGAFPRYRYDQLMRLGWKVFLPFSLGWVFLTAIVLISMNWLPF